MKKQTQASAPKKSGLRWSKYIKPYIPYFIIGPLCMIVEVIGEVLMPKFLSMIINYGVSGQEIDSPIVAWLFNLFGEHSPFIIAIAAGMIVTAVLMMLGGLGGAYFGAKAAVNFATDLRGDIYRKVQKFSFANIDKFNTGSIVTRMTNDVTQLQNFVNMMLRMALRSPGMLIGALIMAILLKPSLTIVIAVAIPILVIFIALFIKVGFPRFTRMQSKIDGLNLNVQENITNVRVVKSFVREDHESHKFAAANAELKGAGRSAMLMMILISPLMSFCMNAATIAVLWFGGNMVISGDMLIGDLTAFVTYMTQILSSLMMVTMLFMQFSRAMASAKRIKEIMNEEIDITDDGVVGADRELTVKHGEVEFKNVSFGYYKNREEKVLENIDLYIPAGSTVGIIGSTGSGKSTLVSMIPRLYDVDAGEVLVDGVNVKSYTLHNLREGVGMVLQKNVLFSGTIEDNLRWGDGNADEQTVRRMADYAQADGFITSFKDGYKSELGQGGTNVSGGQKQRLCIARALLKRPKILILDDSTSAVDTATEAKIRHAFATELAGSTKIIIAQRITSVMNADKIVVINEGRITGIGTHAELLDSNTEYKEIYESQMDGMVKAGVIDIEGSEVRE
ncbi:MAG: ABC transporter ATP-binding protein [Ruminococcaceae bacterium]|nr:ABC transporter ATP-binding protein [Oscillospiraceae bacterium]